MAEGKAWGEQTFMRRRERACKDFGGKLTNIHMRVLTHKLDHQIWLKEESQGKQGDTWNIGGKSVVTPFT